VLESQIYSNLVQARAAEALGSLGGIDAENALIRVLNDPNQKRQIRLRTVSAFGRLNTEIAYKQLFNVIKSPTEMPLIRERAVAALASYLENEDVRTILINLLKDSNQNHALRSRAGDILVRINDNQVREIFLGLLSDPNESPKLRAKAALCLGALGNSTDITVLSDITQDHRYELRLRWCAAYAIGYILRKVEDKPSIVLLGKILEDETEHHFVRWTAAYALGFSQDEQALQSLTRTVSSKSVVPDVKRRIIESISKFKIDDAVNILIRLYNFAEQDSGTKDAILLGLCSIGGEQARDILVEAIRNKQISQNIQRRIIIALGVLGDEAEVSLLQNIINDETISIELRDAAFTALEQISRSLRKRIYTLKKEPNMTIEVLGIPILTKAIDFLFDETKKILEERRDARKIKGSDAAPPPNIPLLNQNKDDVLRETVSEKDFKSLSPNIEDSILEVETYQRNLQNIRKTIASQGGIVNADIRWRNQLKENEDGLLEASQRLAQLINDITKK
jgi:HEAT repeat protein